MGDKKEVWQGEVALTGCERSGQVVVNQESTVIYKGNGAATQFPFTFSIIEAADVKIIQIDSAQNERRLTSDFFVDTVAGVVHYPGYPLGQEPQESERPPVLPEGWQLVIYREIEAVQKVDFGAQWPFPTIEAAFDKLTMLGQQAFERLTRCIVFPVSSGFNGLLPAPVAKDAALQTNKEGTGLMYGASPTQAMNMATAAADKATHLETLIEGAQIGDARTLAGQTGEALKEDIVAAVAAGYAQKGEVTQQIAAALDKAVRLLGEVAAQSDLPADAAVGDLYKVKEAEAFYLWDGTQWGTMGGGDGIAVGTLVASITGIAPEGCLLADGALPSRAAFPALWAVVKDLPALQTDAQWLADKALNGFNGHFSDGDGATTFRLPDLTGAVFKGVTAAEAGRFEGDAIRNITGSFGVEIYDPKGAFRAKAGYGYACAPGANTIVELDASLQVPTADEVRVKNIGVVWYVKAFHKVVQPAAADMTQLANDVAGLSSDVAGLLDKGIESTWIYLDGTDPTKPSSVSINQRLEFDSPYPGHALKLKVFLYVPDYGWGEPGWMTYYTSSWGSAGLAAGQYENKVVLQAAMSNFGSAMNLMGGSFPVSTNLSSGQVRIYVEKGGLLP